MTITRGLVGSGKRGEVVFTEVAVYLEDVPETPSPQLLRAFWRGALAHTKAKPIRACPYKDVTNSIGGPTWSRTFRRHWRRGWEASARVERAKALTPERRREIATVAANARWHRET